MKKAITMSVRQKRIIIAGSILFVAALLSYFFIIKPLVAKHTEEEKPPELLEGEVLGDSNRILMMEHIEMADIKSIEVHNQHGAYTFYRASDDAFYIKGQEGAPYSYELLSSLVVSAGYTLSMTRVTTDCTDFHEYGLAEEDNPAYYIITKNDGTAHKIYIGNLLATGGGYYARYDGRGAVYVLDTTIAATLLADINSMIKPVLGRPLATNDYYTTDDIYLIRNGKLVVFIDYRTPQEVVTEAGMGDYVMKYPTAYTVNTSTVSSLLETLKQFYGDKTIEFGKDILKYLEENGDGEETGESDSAETGDDDEADMEFISRLKESYGIDIDNPAYLLHYTYKDMQTFVIFSEPDEDGNMYAFSSLYDLVAQINISSCEFLNWDLLKFVDRPLYAENINDVSSIEIDSELVKVKFTLEGEGQEILIRSDRSDTPYGATDVKNFRQWYKDLLSMKLQDYAKNTDTDSLTLYATFTFTMDNGETIVYRFYPYSTHHCYYTVNGVGEFYTMNNSVEKVLTDAVRLLNGDSVDADRA